MLAQEAPRVVRNGAARRAEAVQDQPRLLPEDTLGLVEVLLLVAVVGHGVLGDVPLAVRPFDVHLVRPAVLPVVEESAVGVGVGLDPVDEADIAPLEALADDADRGGMSAALHLLDRAGGLGVDGLSVQARTEIIKLDDDIPLLRLLRGTERGQADRPRRRRTVRKRQSRRRPPDRGLRERRKLRRIERTEVLQPPVANLDRLALDAGIEMQAHRAGGIVPLGDAEDALPRPRRAAADDLVEDALVGLVLHLRAHLGLSRRRDAPRNDRQRDEIALLRAEGERSRGLNGPDRLERLLARGPQSGRHPLLRRQRHELPAGLSRKLRDPVVRKEILRRGGGKRQCACGQKHRKQLHLIE